MESSQRICIRLPYRLLSDFTQVANDAQDFLRKGFAPTNLRSFTNHATECVLFRKRPINYIVNDSKKWAYCS
jgi:hypothetical protein